MAISESIELRLGTASWAEGASERRVLVASLSSDPERLVRT
jgi:hypothetical protein